MASLFDVVASPVASIGAVISDRPTMILDGLGYGAWGN
ncbi:MAG: hypothetical protein M2R45_04251 [Verrucomicrobia subdivision 3 bacterium]|nr:hypothetical protein [Limisphaerales bacterium]MCS1412625.1 hypothetical protein [Limisphaerales bacterium]